MWLLYLGYIAFAAGIAWDEFIAPARASILARRAARLEQNEIDYEWVKAWVSE